MLGHCRGEERGGRKRRKRRGGKEKEGGKGEGKGKGGRKEENFGKRILNGINLIKPTCKNFKLIGFKSIIT